MDISLRRFHPRFLQALTTRFPSLPKNAPKLRIPIWGWALPLAFLLAAWAHHGSQEEGRLSWLTQNFPSLSAWQDVLHRRGFSAIEDPAWREKAYAEMPEASRLK